MAGDLQGMRQRAGGIDERYERARERLRQTQQASLDRRAKKRQEEERLRQERALEAQRIAAQERQDNKRAQTELASNAQRATYAADAAAADFRYRSKLNDQEQRGTLKRTDIQNQFEAAQARQRALDQERRDRLQFGFSQQENQQQFENQMQRDAAQNQFTNQRDFMQFGYDTLRGDQQQQQTLERDKFQQEQQQRRDMLLNEFEVQGDQRAQKNIIERAQLDQKFTQQNMYQRQAEEISAKWQDQIAQARNAGLDFSERQKKEINDLDAAFRKNVLNGPYDELIKQQAMVEHQKKLAAIVPEQRVVTDAEQFANGTYFDPKSQMLFAKRAGRNGAPEYDPIGTATPNGTAINQQQRQQQQQQEKQLETVRKAKLEREDRFQEILDAVSTAENKNGDLLFGTPEAAMEEAMRRFEPYEATYRQDYGLPPLAPYKAKEEAKQAAEAMRRQQAIDAVKPDPQKMNRMNPWNEYLRERAAKKAPPPGTSPVNTAQRGIDHSDPRNSTAPPVLLVTKDLDWKVKSRLGSLPGGIELGSFRDRHSGKDIKSQTIRQAADIVIHSMIMNDTSDPDLAEAFEILKHAGYTPSTGKK